MAARHILAHSLKHLTRGSSSLALKHLSTQCSMHLAKSSSGSETFVLLATDDEQSTVESRMIIEGLSLESGFMRCESLLRFGLFVLSRKGN